MRCWNK